MLVLMNELADNAEGQWGVILVLREEGIHQMISK